MAKIQLDERKSVAVVLESSERVRVLTENALAGIRQRTEPAINCLLRLVECTGPQSEGEDARAYEWWAQATYLSAGHTSVALGEMLHRGFYLESAILLRHLTELLVQVRYFEHHTQRVLQHLSAKRAKDRVKFQSMFDEVAPGYYRTYYSLASGMAHGGVASTMLRVDMTASKGRFGCHYDPDQCTLVANTWAAALHRFLTSFEFAFPQMKLDAGNTQLLAAVTGLAGWLEAAWREHPKSHDWLRTIGPLVRWVTPSVAP
jgi:hypothetical protein